ncbi:hypothetical protein ACWD6P_02825 [Streptomyces sp. NPDC002446]
MEELTFEGVSLGELTAPLGPPSPRQADGAPVGRPGTPLPLSPAALVATLVEQLQRAHASVLDAHQAIAAWQFAHTAPLANTADTRRTNERWTSGGQHRRTGHVRTAERQGDAE